MKPLAAIEETTWVVKIDSRLLNWANEELSELFQSGLPLKLAFRAAIFEERAFWFDAQITSVTIRKHVSYDPVKKSFTIAIIDGSQEKSLRFVDKNEAMDELLKMAASIPMPLAMEKYPKRTYYAGVCCEVRSSEMDFPLNHILWFMREGYTTDWVYSEKILTKVLHGNGASAKHPSATPGKVESERREGPK